jgi:hypothetical protein
MRKPKKAKAKKGKAWSGLGLNMSFEEEEEEPEEFGAFSDKQVLPESNCSSCLLVFVQHEHCGSERAAALVRITARLQRRGGAAEDLAAQTCSNLVVASKV